MIKKSAKKFRREFRKSSGTAIVAALGLLTALAWKDVITEWLNKIINLNPLQGKFVAAMIITLISVIAIMIITKIIPSEE